MLQSDGLSNICGKGFLAVALCQPLCFFPIRHFPVTTFLIFAS
jgi:hypothetical protein